MPEVNNQIFQRRGLLAKSANGSSILRGYRFNCRVERQGRATFSPESSVFATVANFCWHDFWVGGFLAKNLDCSSEEC
jgi:hypothetical protein